MHGGVVCNARCISDKFEKISKRATEGGPRPLTTYLIFIIVRYLQDRILLVFVTSDNLLITTISGLPTTRSTSPHQSIQSHPGPVDGSIANEDGYATDQVKPLL